jgi:glucuronide carrier protein
MTTNPLGWSRIIGYGLGDVANNFAFAMGALFLLNYYTDVAGIGAAAAGTMLLLVRIFDAVMDVVAGRVVDSTSTRWGRFRPFLLWGALPLMAMSVLVFSVPHGWSHDAKLAYAYATYAALGLAYSFVNIPYGSLATVMTQDAGERARLGAARSLMAAATFAFLAFVLGPRIRGAADAQAVFTTTTLMLAVGGIVLYFACFSLTREVVTRTVERPALGPSLRTLFRNGPLMMLCASALLMLIASFSVNASAVFYARYVLGGMEWFVPIVVVNLLFGTLVAAPLVPMLVTRIGKKLTFIAGACLAAAGYLMLYAVPAGQTTLALVTLAVAAVGAMITMTVTWALEADTVEFGEWKTGLRIEGLTYSFFSFTRKTGQALGGSVPAYLLAMSDYVPNAAVQGDAARLSIVAAFTLVPAAAFALSALLMAYYPLTEARFALFLKDIQARRAA